MSKTREKYPLSPSKPIKKTIQAVIIWVIVLAIIGGITLFFLNINNISLSSYTLIGTGGILLFIVLLFLINYIYQRLYFNSYFYDFTEGFIVIRKGVIMPTEISIPYERVQDVYVDQDLFDRIFRLYDVHLSTATMTSGMEAHIDGVEKEAADGLRNTLLATIGEKIRKTPARNS